MKDLHFFIYAFDWNLPVPTWNKMCFSVTCSFPESKPVPFRLQCGPGPIVKRAVSPHGLIFIRNKNLFQKPLPFSQYIDQDGSMCPLWSWNHHWRGEWNYHGQPERAHVPPGAVKRLLSWASKYNRRSSSKEEEIELVGRTANPVCMVWPVRLVGVPSHRQKRGEEERRALARSHSEWVPSL